MTVLPEYYTTKEAAEKLGYKAADSLKQYCAQGKIPAYKAGTMWLIPKAWVIEQEIIRGNGKINRMTVLSGHYTTKEAIDYKILYGELVMNQRMTSANDYKEVAKVAAKYIEAIRTGNIDMLDNIFHKNAVAYGTVNGELVGGAGNPAIEFIKANGKSPEIEFHIDVIDITPTTAVVRIVMEKDAIGSDCNANLLLIKLNDGWNVMAKVFHQFDK